MAGFCAASLSWESHVAEHVQQIRNKKCYAHLFLQQPASQPWVFLDELLIAQAVLYCSGYVTHPNGCRLARRTSVSSETDLHRLLQAIQQIEASDQYANAGLDDGGDLLHEEMALVEGCRWRRMIQQLPWQPHPYQEEIKTERDGGGMETERWRLRERKWCEAKWQMEWYGRLVLHFWLGIFVEEFWRNNYYVHPKKGEFVQL